MYRDTYKPTREAELLTIISNLKRSNTEFRNECTRLRAAAKAEEESRQKWRKKFYALKNSILTLTKEFR